MFLLKKKMITLYVISNLNHVPSFPLFRMEVVVVVVVEVMVVVVVE